MFLIDFAHLTFWLIEMFVSPAMLYTQFDIYTHKIQKLGVTLLFLQIIKKSNMEDFYGH